ncbi:MAG: glycosyltransferase [bacterium]|nr:glycosyltransferase [bacterium]
MKVALIHDYLNQWGGAERVLEVLAEMFPDAPIYTLLYDEEKTLHKFSGNIGKYRKIITSFLDKPRVRKNHRPFIPLMPLAMRLLKLDPSIDLVISSSASFAKGIHLGPNTKHLSYIHSPLRYAWETDYLPPETTSPQRFLYKPLLSYLRRWDFSAAQKPEILVANSVFISRKIKEYYGRDSLIIYPPVDLSIFNPDTKYDTQNSKKYFLAIGRFLHYKKFDLIIETFRELGLPLKIVGRGREEEKLKKLASGTTNIEFLPFAKNDMELKKLYQNARALIFPQIEDFGLVAAESIACGTPVIAYNAGGAKEIVNNYSGILFPQQTQKFLVRAVNEFILKENNFKPEIVAEQAKKFSKDNFILEINKIIKQYFTPH